jgi:hypothetical protein
MVLKKSVGEVRISNGRKEKTSFCMTDSQSVKTQILLKKGHDAGKNISGIKRHIPPTAPHSLSSIIRGWYNRPNSGRRTS